jgi:hypothetical protein
MIAESNIKLIITLKDPDLDPEELEKQTRNLVREMEDVGVEYADLVAVEEIPEGSKAFGGFLLGLLQAEVSVANIKRVLGFIGDRIGSQPIELEVEANGKKLKVKASSQEELRVAIQEAQKFVAAG